MIVQNQIQKPLSQRSEQLFVQDKKQENREKGKPFSWNRICPYCGAEEMVPAGSCHVCRNCGMGSGCS